MNKSPIILILMVSLVLLCVGCAKPDWIEQTLVTVDVSGPWVGWIGRTSGIFAEVRLELEQQGPKVKGSFRQTGAGMGGFGLPLTGPIDGTVRGDVLSFELTSLSAPGELTVNGDEMNGFISLRGKQSISLRRVSTSPRPTSQP